MSRTGPIATSDRIDIAVIGLSCHLPGAESLSAFWENLRMGRESVTFFGTEEADSVVNPYGAAPNFVRAASAIEDVDLFDADLFGISAREAVVMDPQHRRFLQSCWECFEDSGYDPQKIRERVGVYATCGNNTYLLNHVHPGSHHFHNRSFLESLADFRLLLGSEKDFLATRVSYCFNLRGPSINVQSACSSFLVALHMACEGLQQGDCDLSLVGCSTIRLPQKGGYLFEEGIFASPDGHTRTFDAEARGTVFGSGVGAVLLKPLTVALSDGDHVYAVVKGTAVTNDGARKLAFSAPGVEGQAEAIRLALARADAEPNSVSFIECHGTGTPLGDLVEVTALAQVFGGMEREACALGAVKTNIGHLSWSAGLAGFIKTVLSLEHKQIVPTLHYTRPHPELALEDTPFYVNTSLKPWVTAKMPRRAGVSAFGLGGANAHVVLEEAPEQSVRLDNPDRQWNLFTLSAAAPESLVENVQKYISFLNGNPDVDLNDLCFTVAVGRSHLTQRFAAAVDSVAMLAKSLEAWTKSAANARDGASLQPAKRASRQKVGFLFTGQGCQYTGMGADLYASQPLFRAAIQECEEYLLAFCPVRLTEVLFNPTHADLLLKEPRYTQAALFSFQVALARLWLGWGVKPDVVMGHSTGEYAAACVAGVFSLEEGIRLCAARGQLLQNLDDHGAMVTVFASEADVRRLLEQESLAVSVAAVNGPLSTVLAGRAAAVTKVSERLQSHGFQVQPLAVPRAGHSVLVDGILPAIEDIFATVSLKKPRIAFLSNVTGGILSEQLLEPSYWSRHTRETVRFYKGIQSFEKFGVSLGIEIGPDPVLCGLGAFCLPKSGLQWVPSLRRSYYERFGSQGGWSGLMQAAALLYRQQVPMDFRQMNEGWHCRRISLPTYSFRKERHWMPTAVAGTSETKLKGQSPAYAGRGTHTAVRLDGGDLLEVVWEPAVSLDKVQPGSHSIDLHIEKRTDRWILCADSPRTAASLAEVFRAQSCTTYVIEPGDSRTLERSLKEVLTSHQDSSAPAPQWGVVFAFERESAEREAAESRDIVSPLAATLTAFTAGLMQVLEQESAPAAVWLLTKNAQRVAANDLVGSFDHAALSALARVVSMEHPGFAVRCLDLEDRVEPERVVSVLLSGIDEDRLAIRDGAVFQSRLVQSGPGSALVQPAPDALRLAPGKHYLITGGLRGLGLLTAEWMVKQGARHLVLVGRSPSREAEGVRIAALRANGVEIREEQCDIALPELVESLFSRLAAKSIVLGGIVHAAGVLIDGLATSLLPSTLDKVLRPKVQGAGNLHRASLDLGYPLDHFVLFSSAASLIGNPGQSAHAAANAYLDGLAHYRGARGLTTTAINWGAWTSSGLLASNEELRQQVLRHGFEPLSNEQGMDWLGYALHQPRHQLGVSPMNWETFLSYANQLQAPFFRRVLPCEQGSKRSAEGANLRTRIAQSSGEARYHLLLTTIIEELSRVLGAGEEFAARMAPEQDVRFTDMGIDSLTSLELRNRLQSVLGCPLPLTVIFQFPTLRHLTEFLMSCETEAVANIPEAETDAETLRIPEVSNVLTKRALSSQQRRWLHLVRAGYGKRVVPLVFNSELQPEALTAALFSVVSQHELLRYIYTDDGAVALPLEEVVNEGTILHFDLSHLAGPELQTALHEHLSICRADPQDLSKEPSWRVRCLRFPGKIFVLLLSLTHIEFDGSSLSTFLEELQAAYVAHCAGKAPALPSVRQYYEFVTAQGEYAVRSLREDRSFFEGLYATLRGTTFLPGHAGFKRTVPHISARHTPRQVQGLWRTLEGKSNLIGVTPFSIMLAAYTKMLACVTKSQEVVIAGIINGRADHRFRRTIGPFTAPFPLRIAVDGHTPEELARECHHIVQSINGRSLYPVADLIDHVPAFRGFPGDTYFTDVGINFTNYSKGDGKPAPFKIELLEVLGPIDDERYTGADTLELPRIPGLHLIVDLHHKECRFTFWYHKHRFSIETVEEWSNMFMENLRLFD